MSLFFVVPKQRCGDAVPASRERRAPARPHKMIDSIDIIDNIDFLDFCVSLAEAGIVRDHQSQLQGFDKVHDKVLLRLATRNFSFKTAAPHLELRKMYLPPLATCHSQLLYNS